MKIIFGLTDYKFKFHLSLIDKISMLSGSLFRDFSFYPQPTNWIRNYNVFLGMECMAL